MTQKELEAQCPDVPEPAIMALLDLYNCYEEVKEGANHAAEDGVVGRWLPVGRGE